ncbi:sensor histidine kinase [Ostreibacterium oceani]|uniref:histidine kinase n=1 Tax=Ostreibacterium oceani TaxID=2654998 RepID=A0A6N7ER08_9GAMM|nr:HAMP domain-containing sensor histidine kinase [Ostreibacterium oceani]MPV85294.1 HAMP domain-containing protein [Ostreibacterium oceani]
MPSQIVDTLPFRYTLAFAFFIMVAVIFGLGHVYLFTYQALETQAKNQIAAEIAIFRDNPTLANQQANQQAGQQTGQQVGATTLKIWAHDLSKPLPDSLRQQLLNHPQKLYQPHDFFTTPQHTNIKPGMIVGAVSLPVAPDAGYTAHTAPHHTESLLLIALPVDNKPLLRTLLYTLFYLVISIFLLMVVYSYMIGLRSQQKIKTIDSAARDIMAGNLDKRIPIYRHDRDEYSQLAKTLNAMLDKISALMKSTKQVNNHIAHDLRSPLNRLRSRMEIALLNVRDPVDYQNALADSIADCDSLLQTFNALLLIGNLESGARHYHLKPLDLHPLLQDLADLYSAVAEEKNHQFSDQISPHLTVLGHPDLLAQAIGNLLENAMKYTPEGGEISLQALPRGEFALIRITDNGPGIPAQMRDNVFDSFTRLDEARSLPGTGLGMSIVRAVIQAHHASIQLSDNQPGLCVEIRLRLRH